MEEEWNKNLMAFFFLFECLYGNSCTLRMAQCSYLAYSYNFLHYHIQSLQLPLCFDDGIFFRMMQGNLFKLLYLLVFDKYHSWLYIDSL